MKRALGFGAVAVLIVAAFLTRNEGASGVAVSGAEYGDAWPFTVPSATLRCEPGGAVTVEANGQRYAVNGTALAAGYPEVDPIWRDHPDPYAPKVSIGPLIDRGLSLCP